MSEQTSNPVEQVQEPLDLEAIRKQLQAIGALPVPESLSLLDRVSELERENAELLAEMRGLRIAIATNSGGNYGGF
jgi:hypothetical protein